MSLPNGLLIPMAFSARFFYRMVYTTTPTRPRTRMVQPIAIPATTPELIEAPPCAETIFCAKTMCPYCSNIYKSEKYELCFV